MVRPGRFLAVACLLLLAGAGRSSSAAIQGPTSGNKYRPQIHHHLLRDHHHQSLSGMGGGGAGGSLSSRPTPSQDLPIIGLIEPKDTIYDPKIEDLNYKTLREKMANHFDANFMSVQRPLDSLLHPNGTLELSFKRTKRGKMIPVGKMPPEIRRLKMRYLPLTDGGRVRMHIGKKMRRKFKQMLWSYTYCPVVYRWKDLGVRFWPRWIREGSCYSGGGSCSIPAGMSCKPKRSAGKNVLRWHCQDWNQKKLCKWLSVRYPVVTECTCGC